MKYDENLYALFSAQANATPDAIAIVEGITTSTSYAELDRQATQIAAYLYTRHLSTEQPVGVMLPRTATMIAALLGILKSGSAYVPIDPDDPIARRLKIMTASGCKLVLTNDSSIDESRTSSLNFSSSVASIELLDINKIHVDSEEAALTAIASGGDRLAYIIFTSGSLGEPKGVEIEHRSVVNLLTTTRNLIGFTSADCFLAASTVGFDISVVELFLPLITGGRLLLRDRNCLMQPRQLAEDIRQYGVSVMQTGPSVWAVILAGVTNFPHLRVVISTAESLPHDLGRKLIDIGDQVWNLYGPTETTIWSTGLRITTETKEDPAFPCSSISIGHPLANTYLRIINEQGERVLDGEHGELCLAGMGLARGYYNNKALTLEKFVKMGDDQQRYYKTGDIVSWSAEGTLLYHGRNDEQMKIHGVRIDPGEVEACLLSHPGVAQAAITWYQGTSTARSVIAAIVVEKDSSVTPRQLYDWLTVRLPAPMIPSRYTFCNVLPLSNSGKVDRFAVRELAEREVDTSPRHARTLTHTERKVMRIWQRVLGIENIALNDHFFSMGGDSLAAVSVIAHIEDVFIKNLSVRLVFEAPTIEQFAAHIDALGAKPVLRYYMSKLRTFAVNAILKQGWFPSINARNINGTLKEVLSDPEEVIDIESIFAKQLALVASWPGKRLTPTSFIFTLNDSGQKQGIFWCTQGAREFKAFANLLGPQQPIHAMRSHYLLLHYGYEPEARKIAARYATEMNELQAEGPFLLGGNCAGSAIIRMVADELQNMGREVSLLILMEIKIFTPFNEKVALIFGKESHLNPYLAPNAEPDLIFRKAYPAGYTVDLISGAHGEFFSPHNVGALMEVMEKRIRR
ncbi:MAG: amino acid adenylation domain-containing protein [Colwellia sp.]|nr:amino acid adenylation domain-containing protein [Colwellia sp.]